MARHPWVSAADQGIRWGVQLIVPNRQDALPELMQTGRAVEQLGYDAIYIFDHPKIHVDPWIALSGLAVATERVRLGSAVNCAGYRHPGHLARLSADLDNLSRGRHILGIGSGWWELEYNALDVPFDPLPKRQRALSESLQVITGVWGDQPFSFDGEHVRTKDLRIEPGPFQQPRPPILIGGSGERVTLRQVARYGDACNVREEEALSDDTIPDSRRAATVKRKLDALRGHCDELGRPFDEVLRTHFTLYLLLAPTETEAKRKLDRLDTSVSTSPGTRRSGKASILAASPERAIAYDRAMAEVGIQYFIVQLDGTDHETIRLLAEEVAPHV
ncbi:MAG: LLM class flavin-dependent oxidoreductase [Thermomicrobiales bacterium]|nr:LLM class flavin-dependent oxidoreductase [Thermomicrobiales bacterium]